MELAKSHWSILVACSENRQTRANLAAKSDLSPDYVSSKLSELKQYNLIEQPGPAENSGMWVTSPAGNLAVERQTKYQREHSELFGALVTDAVDLADELSRKSDQDVSPQDIILTSGDAFSALRDLSGESSFRAHDAQDRLDFDNIFAVHGILYELWFFDLVSRADTSEGQVYDIAGKGRALLDKSVTPPLTPVNVNRAWFGIPGRRDE